MQQAGLINVRPVMASVADFSHLPSEWMSLMPSQLLNIWNITSLKQVNILLHHTMLFNCFKLHIMQSFTQINNAKLACQEGSLQHLLYFQEIIIFRAGTSYDIALTRIMKGLHSLQGGEQQSFLMYILMSSFSFLDNSFSQLSTWESFFFNLRW